MGQPGYTMLKARIISIGDELLIGQTVNTNAAWLGRKMSEIGIPVVSVMTIGDEPGAIRTALHEAMQSADIVLMTGGLGPTHDDITKAVVADYFRRKLVLDEHLLEKLRQAFASRGLEFVDSNKGQAMIPEGTQIFPNRVGSAQGMLFEQDGRYCLVMPGVPREMEYIMTRGGGLAFFESITTGEVIVHHTWRTTGIAESILYERLGDMAELERYGKIAFLPKYTGVDIRLTVHAPTRDAAQERIAAADRLIRAQAGKYIFGTGDDLIEAAIGSMLAKDKLRLAVAESCTGGLIARRITDIPGSSAYFTGGVVAYSNEQKMALLGVAPDTLEKHGAVSEETAREMAVGVREKMRADYALSITGIAGPTGGTEEKPVGLVFIGLAHPGGVEVKRRQFGKDRTINRERSAQAALHLLYQVLVDR